MQKKWYLYGLSAVLALAVACGGDSNTTPASPSVPTASTANGSAPPVSAAAAAADGSTLKVSAPAPYSPASNAQVDNWTPSLVVNNSTGTYVSAPGLTYRFEVSETSGAVAETAVEPEGAGSGGAGRTMHVVAASAGLKVGTTYRWRARAESPAGIGPWSGYSTFITPATGGASFQDATTLWDNLTDGRSIGTLVNAQLTPKGVYLPNFNSHVTYQLQSTLTSGTIQFLIEGLDVDTNGGKTKIVSMQQGYSDITDNPYRFNVEKRGDDHPDSGKFRMRIITGNASNFYDSDRLVPSSLSRSKTYHVNVTWGSGAVRLVVREGSNTGPTVVSGGMNYSGTYRPNPHVVHIGCPIPRGGEVDATVPGITVRYFFVSQGGTWPGFAPLDQMVGLLTRTGSGN